MPMAIAAIPIAAPFHSALCQEGREPTELQAVNARAEEHAVIRVKENDDLAELVTNHMLKVEGIADSETLIAFRVFSRHDLESMFSVGM